MQVGSLRWVVERHPEGRPVGGKVHCRACSRVTSGPRSGRAGAENSWLQYKVAAGCAAATACETHGDESVGGPWGCASASVRGSGSRRSAVKSMVAVRRAQLEQFVVF